MGDSSGNIILRSRSSLTWDSEFLGDNSPSPQADLSAAAEK